MTIAKTRVLDREFKIFSLSAGLQKRGENPELYIAETSADGIILKIAALKDFRLQGFDENPVVEKGKRTYKARLVCTVSLSDLDKSGLHAGKNDKMLAPSFDVTVEISDSRHGQVVCRTGRPGDFRVKDYVAVRNGAPVIRIDAGTKIDALPRQTLSAPVALQRVPV